jgi:hypothetical protein
VLICTLSLTPLPPPPPTTPSLKQLPTKILPSANQVVPLQRRSQSHHHRQKRCLSHRSENQCRVPSCDCSSSSSSSSSSSNNNNNNNNNNNINNSSSRSKSSHPGSNSRRGTKLFPDPRGKPRARMPKRRKRLRSPRLPWYGSRNDFSLLNCTHSPSSCAFAPHSHLFAAFRRIQKELCSAFASSRTTTGGL